jgi:hypothetical protein
VSWAGEKNFPSRLINVRFSSVLLILRDTLVHVPRVTLINFHAKGDAIFWFTQYLIESSALIM